MRAARQVHPASHLLRETFRASGPGTARRERGYQLIEALVYLSLLFALIGVGYAALYRCIDFSVLLRRNSDDITRAIKAGEFWRADIRAAGGSVRLETLDGVEVLRLSSPGRDVYYAFRDHAIFRRAGNRPWVNVLGQVKSSAMRAETQFDINAWHWELELEPQAKGSIKASRVRPLFSFIAVSQPKVAP
jgi:hypothetical protein